MIAAAKSHNETIGDWHISSMSSSISSASEIEAFETSQSMKCPEMPFLRNHLTFTHQPSSLTISINAINALKGCLWNDSDHTIDQMIKVTHAEAWKDKAHDVDVQVLDTKYDWTYTTYYAGDVYYQSINQSNNQSINQSQTPIEQLINQSINPSPSIHTLPEPHPIPLTLLQKQDPILYFTHLPLFDDELHDNGHSTCFVKSRFMHHSFLILLTFFLRVDGVLLRVIETRFYHEMGTNTVTREFTIRQESWDSLAKRGKPTKPSDYTDVNTFSTKLPIIKQGRQKIMLTPVTSMGQSNTVKNTQNSQSSERE